MLIDLSAGRLGPCRGPRKFSKRYWRVKKSGERHLHTSGIGQQQARWTPRAADRLARRDSCADAKLAHDRRQSSGGTGSCGHVGFRLGRPRPSVSCAMPHNLVVGGRCSHLEIRFELLLVHSTRRERQAKLCVYQRRAMRAETSGLSLRLDGHSVPARPISAPCLSPNFVSKCSANEFN